MEYLSSDKIGIIDLSTSEVIEESLEEDLVQEYIGGAGITSVLYEKYKEDNPIVLGTGLLAGTLLPGSALGLITAKSPVTDKLVHIPLTLYVGVELKYCGFDYLVIKGKAQNPVYLWLHDGIADIEDAADLWGKDTWHCTDHIRKTMGDDIIQVLGIGNAGESGSDLAQVVCNYWGSADWYGIGKIFGEKNLKLVALRGMGLIEIADPEGFVETAISMISEVKSAPFMGKQGVADILAELGHQDVKDWIDPLVHRHRSCFNTPVPTNTFIFTDEDPSQMKESEKEEPGVLITDPLALLALKNLGLSAKDAGVIIKACAKEGMDVQRVAQACQKLGKTSVQDILNSLAQITESPEISYGEHVFSAWCPRSTMFDDFGVGDDESELNKWWTRRQSLAYVFGIHPMFVLMSSHLTEEKLLELARLGTEMEFDLETLDRVISGIQG